MTAVAEPEWVVEERVPVYDAHELEVTDPKTGKVVRREKVTQEKLEAIANARNAKIKRSGNPAPILVGHSRLDIPEWQKAKWSPHVGWADSFEVGPHETDGRPTMYARLAFAPSVTVGNDTLSAEQVMKLFPHRSAEIAPDLSIVDAVSLLHPGNTPAREMGLLRMAAAADPNVMTSDPEPPMEPQGDRCNDLIAALMQVLEQFAGGGAEQPPAAPPAEAPAQYAACSPTNGTLPDDKLEKVRMQRDSDAIKQTQRDAEVTTLRQELANLKLQYQRERREKDLIQLEAEGYDLNRSEELDRLTPLADETYTAELGRIKKHYQRMPAGSIIRTAPPAGDKTIFTPAQNHDQVKDWIMRNPGKSREDAVAALGTA